MKWSPENYRDHLSKGGKKLLKHVAHAPDYTNVMTCSACDGSIKVRLAAGMDYSDGIDCPLCDEGQLSDVPELIAVEQRAVCPGCNLPVDPVRLVYVAVLPQYFRGDQTWACDGCWTIWQRDLRPFEPGQTFRSRLDWDREWMRRLGAPETVLEKRREA